MAVEALVTPLLNVGLFQGLSPLQLAKIAKVSERIVFKPDEVVIRAGDEGDAAFLIVAGEAMRINDPTDPEDMPLAPSTLVGEMAMLVETEHSATVVTRSKVRAMKITREALHGLMLEDPGLAEHFLGKIVARLGVLADELRRIDAGLAVGDDREAGAAPAEDEADGARAATLH